MKGRFTHEMVCGPHEVFAPGIELQLVGMIDPSKKAKIISATRISDTIVSLELEVDIPDSVYPFSSVVRSLI